MNKNDHDNLTTLLSEWKEFRTNHWPHMERKVNWLIGLAIASIVAGKVELAQILALFK